MEMPKVVEAHKKLERLAGNWTGEEKMHPSPWDPQGGPATGRMESRMALDGFFLISEYVQERNGEVCYRGHGLLGWDPYEKCCTMHWFDSIGTPVPAPAKGAWKGDTLTFEQRSPMGHHRYTFELKAERKYEFRIDHSQDGKQWMPFMEGTYTR